jgi:nicotinamidase-related amidase
VYLFRSESLETRQSNMHCIGAIAFSFVVWSNVAGIFGFAPNVLHHVFRGIRDTSAVSTKLSDSTNSDPLLEPIASSETAFVFIEYQNEFCSPGGKLYDAVKECLDKTDMLQRSIQTAQTARSSGCTVIHCPISFKTGHKEISDTPYGILAGVKNGEAFTAGTWGADFVNGMKPVSGDLTVKGKSGLCGFASTNLDFLLRQNNIKNVVLSGFLTNCCVESTMRTAYENGYKVYTLQDCVAATSIAAQDATLMYNFGMFSIPTTSKAILTAVQSPVVTV